VPTSLLPSLLTSTLGASPAALGVIEGVNDALAGFARLGRGALADDPHRRRTVAVGGYTATAAWAAATGAATSVGQVAVLRAGAWTARGLCLPARNALSADVVPAQAYGRAYGFERVMDHLGAIAGPLLAIGLVAAVGTRWAIGLSVLPRLPPLWRSSTPSARPRPHMVANALGSDSRSGRCCEAVSAGCSRHLGVRARQLRGRPVDPAGQ
jgi:MFS family permease